MKGIKWWQALNPAIYLISVLPGVGVLLAAKPRSLWIEGLLLCTLAVVLLQHAINLLNDVSDWRLGADVSKFDSWVRIHHEDTRIASIHGLISLMAGGLLGIGVLVWAGKLWILLIATPMVGLGYLYNSGSRPLSYTHLGEWVTGLCYGPGVFGCLCFVAGLPPSAATAWGMLAFAALAVALLLSHQPPQIDTDRQAGKQSFAVRYGAKRTRQVARWLFLLFLISFGLSMWSGEAPPLAVWSYAGLALISAVIAWQYPPNPKRILFPATLLMVGSLIVSFPFSVD